MKKLLVSSAALAVAFSAAPGAVAENLLGKTPSVNISGESSASYYVFRGSQKEANGGRGNGHLSRIDSTRINFDILGKTEGWGGLEYSFLLGLSGNTKDGRNPVEESRIKLKGGWGTFMIGTHRGTDHVMPVGAFVTMGATGGVMGGNYEDVINPASGAVYKIDMVGTAKDTNRITYATPRIFGLQFGVSVAALSHQKGDSDPNSHKNDGKQFTRNNVSVGVNYKNQVNPDFVYKLSAVSVFAKAEPGQRTAQNTINRNGSFNVNMNKLNKVFSYALGAWAKYKNFDMGLEFIDNGKSMTFSDIKGAKAGQLIFVALGYQAGADRFSIGYAYGERKMGDLLNNGQNHKAKTNAVSAGWDRSLAPGIGIYGEVNHYDMKTTDRIVEFQNALNAENNKFNEGVGNSHGTVGIVGMKLKF